MLNEEDIVLLNLIRQSMLPGQDGIKMRAFLAFNRDHPLAKAEAVEALAAKDALVVKDDTLYPVANI